MSRPPYLVNTIPVLSTAHVSASTMQWLRELDGDSVLATVAPYREGVVVYLAGLPTDEAMPEEIRALCRWVSRRHYGWLRLDADGDIVNGLPTFAW